MSVLVSKCRPTNHELSKELFKEISENLKIMTDEEWESNRDPYYKRVTSAVYVRTDLDNLVLKLGEDKFVSVEEAPEPLISSNAIYHTLLLDIGYLHGANLLKELFESDSPESRRELAFNSFCFPVGAVEMDDSYVVISNVIVSSARLKLHRMTLNQGFTFQPIESLKDVKDYLQKEILKSLVLVKSEG